MGCLSPLARYSVPLEGREPGAAAADRGVANAGEGTAATERRGDGAIAIAIVVKTIA